MRRLVLYCDQEIPKNYKINKKLLELFNKPVPTVGFIPSCADTNREFYENKKAYFAGFGVDLRVYFELDIDYRLENLSSLLQCDGIYLSGGNTFHFLYWLRARGMIDELRKYVDQGGVLIGASAGAILMSPEISASTFCADAPLPGEETEDLSALNLVNFAFFPHINCFPAHEGQMIQYSREHPHSIYGCANGDGIVVDGGQVEFLGPCKKAENGVLTIV
jgi:dipeptidase E